MNLVSPPAAHTEGESNTSDARQRWSQENISSDQHELIDRDAKVFLHQSLSSPVLTAIRKAEGIWIEDTTGRRYMDFHGNSVHHIGYGHPKLKAAIAKQLDELPFAPRRFTCEPAVELAERLTALAPGDLSKVLFTTGGSDANEVALKIARAATGRFKTLSFWDSFHGAGFGASSVGGEATFRSHIAGPLLPGSEHVASFHPTRCPFGHSNLEDSANACANMIEFILGREGDIGALIAEPMRAIPLVPPKGFWKRIRELCDRHRTLLIFDEIPTGLGKTGKLFACEHDDVVPDILVLGKSLGGGMLPIAAAIARAELDVCGDYAIGHYTHEKNPITTRAALTTLEIIEEEGLVERAHRLGQRAMNRMRELMLRSSIVCDVRGRGLMFGLEIVKDRQTREPDNGLAEEIYYKCLDQGLSFKISQGCVLTLSPPLTITEDELDQALQIVETVIEAGRN